MTEQRDKELPTVAEIGNEGSLDSDIFKEDAFSGKSISYRPKDVEIGDELVRRQDIEQLIENKIEKYTAHIQTVEEVATEANTERAIRKKLEELLEEVQNQ